MLMTRWAAAVLVVSVTPPVLAQEFPNKPIRMLASGIGGDSDLLLRLILPGIVARIGQPIIIENRPSGIIPAEITYKATPDGYTLYTTAAPFWIGSLMQKTPYDVVKDFAPITSLSRSPAVLVVHPTLGANSVKELIAIAKAKPGALNYASGGTGGTSHLSAELLNSMAGIRIVRVNYASGNARMAASLNNEVQLQFPSPGLAIPHAKAGRLKALAVTSAEPTALAPGVPTIAASGLPGYELVGLIGMFAPAKTPAAVVNKVNQEFVRYVNQADVKQRILDMGEEVFTSTPEQFGIKVKSDMTRMGKLIQELGIAAK